MGPLFPFTPRCRWSPHAGSPRGMRKVAGLSSSPPVLSLPSGILGCGGRLASELIPASARNPLLGGSGGRLSSFQFDGLRLEQGACGVVEARALAHPPTPARTLGGSGGPTPFVVEPSPACARGRSIPWGRWRCVRWDVPVLVGGFLVRASSAGVWMRLEGAQRKIRARLHAGRQWRYFLCRFSP